MGSAQPTRLLDCYSAKFALDFTYDEWATGYRENLHAAFLAAMEAQMAMLIDEDHIDDAISIAQRVLTLDPTADAVELLLLRAYKRGGRQAAAAEQYSHYASVVREELGAEPPPFAEI